MSSVKAMTLVDGGGAGEEHDEAVDAEGDTAAGGHGGQGFEKGLGHGVDIAAGLAPPEGLGGEAAALLSGVGELAEAVGELETTGIDLEPLGDGVVAGAEAGERGHGGGVVQEDSGPGEADGGLDAVHEVEVEAAGVRVGAGPPAGEALKGVGDGEAVPGRGQVQGASAALDGGGPADGTGHVCDEELRFFDGLQIAGPGAVPLQHGELRVVLVAALPGAEAAADLEDAVIARREKALHVQLRGGGQVPGAGGNGINVRLGSRGGRPCGGFDVQVAAGEEEGGDGVKCAGAKLQGGAQGGEAVGVAGAAPGVRRCGGHIRGLGPVHGFAQGFTTFYPGFQGAAYLRTRST